MKNPFNMFYPLFAIALLTLFFSCGGNGGRTAGKDGCIVLDMEQALDNGAVDVPLSKYAISIKKTVIKHRNSGLFFINKFPV